MITRVTGDTSGVWTNGLSKRYFPDPPESRESNSISVTRGISHYLFYYTTVKVILR